MGRGVAVALFTDLVGSTELRAQVGEEAADGLRRKHDRVLTHAAEAHEGRVGLMALAADAPFGAATKRITLRKEIE